MTDDSKHPHSPPATPATRKHKAAPDEAGAESHEAAPEHDGPTAVPPDSARDSTRAAKGKGADEAAARQQMRQAGLSGKWHDDVIDLLPALGSPPANSLTLEEVIDLVREHDEGAMATLKRLYAAKK